ncbi:thioredoxin-like domain-containing protein [Magnetospirillum sp. UT-4]|uniref:thioredoxin-like domain-containing protein n=1 Tax=Magnetospirillum sp. UT-4 TaxID=2681467 RepID=UPI00138442E8|nr:thioredoxin-like domain-containing protein [Magnetospirillum sp. UT-4]CAA7626733.1 putative alkyl hydroperoxide reductase/ Thiol specific antioxidant/ Mal allergen [Magnetospirillum sp. UT-4]
MFGITRAPEIDRPGLLWFNVDAPLSLADLKGRLVVLDFWTFCCVNCVHTLPVLKCIEERFADEVAVIGVHSPKFAHECDPAALAGAIARLGITHPVVHDPRLTLWDDYCIRAWPTLAMISPDGYVIGALPGEPHPDLLVEGIGDMVREFFERGELAPRPLAVSPITEGGGRLRFPGKIKRCPDGGARLWAVADGGHHQVALFDDDGGEVARFGSGRPGWQDGTGAAAAFNGPEGLACDERAIYVADTGNHLIRRIDRASGRVDTVAGMAGFRGPALRHASGAGSCALASPWDLEVAGGRLYFANAGSHQLGLVDLAGGTVTPLAGTGAESLVDGPAAEAVLAQPSGLALCPESTGLFFADAESSALRRLDLDGGRVETLVGAGLFDYGHVDGTLAEARLQHPLGLAVADGRVYVADTYNSAIRVVDLAGGSVRDVARFGHGASSGRLPSEPSGIAADGPGRLLVSDSGNHRVLELAPEEGSVRIWVE